VHAVAAHELHVFAAADAAFSNHDAAFAGNFGQQIQRLLQAHFKGAQVAVVHTAQR